MTRKTLTLEDALVPVILGDRDEHLKKLRKALDIDVAVRGSEFTISGSEQKVHRGMNLLLQLNDIAAKRPVTGSDVDHGIRMLEDDESANVADVLTENIKVSGSAKTVSPKSPTQQEYVKAIAENDMVFGIGPAGTGKTFLAMAMAVHFYLTKRVRRIILCRPAVEAGENLGFLPGDIADKINPYLRPLYDALYSMLDIDKVGRLMEQGVIELAPLAFMRGRTLNDSFIILDEAQNTTNEQMKMFLTRLGFNSKAVVTGDITQIDLPTNKPSGLVNVMKILSDTNGIDIVRFTEKDVVRHPLVQRIIKAYESFEESAGS